MAAPSYVGTAVAAQTLGGDPVVTISGIGIQNGDYMLAYGVCAAGSGITQASWTAHPISFGAQGPLLFRWASSEPTSYTFVVSGAGNSIVRVVVYRGVDPNAPYDDADLLSGATGAIVLPSVDSVGADRRLFQGVVKLGSTSFTGPVGVERWDAATSPSNYTSAGGDEVVGAGPTGTRTWTPAAGTAGSIGYILALKPWILSVTGFAPAVAFGTPTLIQDQFVTTTGFTPTVTFGTPSLLREVTPTGFTPTVTFGTPTVIPDVTLPVTGFAAAVVFGTPTVIPDQSLTVTGFVLVTQFGDPNVIVDNFLTVDGFTPTVGFGAVSVATQPVVAGTVFNHETGSPVGAGITVKLFDDNDLLVDSTVTDGGGGFIFYRPIGDTDLYWTLAEYEIMGVQYHGVSDRGCPAV